MPDGSDNTNHQSPEGAKTSEEGTGAAESAAVSSGQRPAPAEVEPATAASLAAPEPAAGERRDAWATAADAQAAELDAWGAANGPQPAEPADPLGGEPHAASAPVHASGGDLGDWGAEPGSGSGAASAAGAAISDWGAAPVTPPAGPESMAPVGPRHANDAPAADTTVAAGSPSDLADWGPLATAPGADGADTQKAAGSAAAPVDSAPMPGASAPSRGGDSSPGGRAGVSAAAPPEIIGENSAGEPHADTLMPPPSIDDLGDAFPREPPPALKPKPKPAAVAEPLDSLGDAFPAADASSRDSGMARSSDDHTVPELKLPAAESKEPAGQPAAIGEIANAVADGVMASALAGNAGVMQPTSAASLPSAIDEAWAEVDKRQTSWRSLTAEERKPSQRRSEPEPPSPQETEVHESPLAPAITPASGEARLVGLSGDDRGTELILGRELIVGRSARCAIVLKDPSVSREHARIYREGRHYFVVDRNSGNGTFVNGERVSRRRLANGDEVAFGKARLQFVGSGDGPSTVTDHVGAAPRSAAAPTATPGPPVTSYVLVSIMILLAASVIALGIIYLRRESRGPARPGAAQYYAAGVAAVQARQWAAAQAQFDAFLSLEPTSEAGRRYVEKIEREKAFEKQLATARAAFGRGELLLAYTQAAAIADSVYAEDARELTRAIIAELDSRIARAIAALDAGRAQEAAERLALVDAIRPTAEVTALLNRARKLAQTQRGDTAFGESRPPARERAAGSTAAVDEAERLFASGRIDDALSRLASAGSSREAQALAAKLKKFEQVYHDGLVEHRAKRADTAIALLEQAKTLEQGITGPGPLASAVESDIRRKLADMYYVRGIDATMAERWADAVASFQAAFANDPGHAATRRKLEDLRGQASELLAQAESARVSDPGKAKARYRLIIQLLPASDERHRKAKQRLDAMP